MPDLGIAAADPASPDGAALRTAYQAELSAVLGSAIPIGRRLTPDADLVPPDGAFWVAALDGTPVGCVGVRSLDGGTVELKQLFVDPAARGHRVGARLIATAEDWARSRGARRVVLDTRSELEAACRLYRATGWTEVEPYNTGSPADLWFAKALSGTLDGTGAPVG